MINISLEKIVEFMKIIEKTNPLVHALTNEITVNDVANAIICCGGSPTMAHHIDEVEEFTANADCLLINLGATEYLDQIYKSGKNKKVIKVFDPVGAAASEFRRAHARKIIKDIKPYVIRANRSEISALYYDKKTAKGVDANDLSKVNESDYIKLVKDFAKKTKAIVVSSGEIDYISDGKEVYSIKNGSKWMKKITGSGCISTGVIASFVGSRPTFEVVLMACLFIALSAEVAEKLTLDEGGGSGTFRIYLLDVMSRFNDSCQGLSIKLEKEL